MFNFSLLGLGGPGAAGAGRRAAFEDMYRVHSMAFAGKPELENGDKMILPQSALADLTSREVQYPMMFRVENPSRTMHTHCGVSEFTAVEGRCHLPYWIMENLMVPEGAMISVRNVQLPKGKFVKFQPHSTDFTRISNPRAVLEKVLRTYSALTKGDTLKLQYAEKVYWVDVLEVKPAVRSMRQAREQCSCDARFSTQLDSPPCVGSPSTLPSPHCPLPTAGRCLHHRD